MRSALESVNERILVAVKRRPTTITSGDTNLPRLIAVSKLKPVSSIIEAYECGQRYFGENYIQELEKKSNDPELLVKCPDIKFHFIGHLQSNKVNKLLKIKNLQTMETVDSINLANLIDKAIGRHRQEVPADQQTLFADESDRLRVLIQVNTSGEEQKNGIQPDEAPQLAEHIVQQCRWLNFAGLMTIGKLDGWPDNDGPNKDFLRLFELRSLVSQRLGVDSQSLELSMGMSSDFEEATIMGSTNIRVGTLIFGHRSPKTTAAS